MVSVATDVHVYFYINMYNYIMYVHTYLFVDYIITLLNHFYSYIVLQNNNIIVFMLHV